MPRYEYKCTGCDYLLEKEHSIKEDPEILCIQCNSLCKRIISSNILFQTPIDIDWQEDPKNAGNVQQRKFNAAKRKKQIW